MVTNQQKAYQAEAEKALASGIPPPAVIKDSRNRSITNPAFTIYQNTINARQKAQVAAQAISEANLTLLNPGVLTRTVSSYLNGKINPSSFNPEEKRQIDTVRLNEQVRSGQISVSEYERRASEIRDTYAKEQAARTDEFGRRAAIKGKSERVKQDTARAVAAGEGIAIGTIGKDSTSISVDSKTATVSTKPIASDVVATEPVKATVPSKGDELTALGLSTIYNVDQNAPLSDSLREGTVSNPFKGKQPNKDLVSPLLRPSGSYVGFSPSGQALLGPGKPTYLVNVLEKETIPSFGKPFEVFAPKTLSFLSEESAQKYVERVKPLMPFEPKQRTFLSTQLNRFAERTDVLLNTKDDPLSRVIIPFAGTGFAIGSSIYNLAGFVGPTLDKLIVGKDTKAIEVKVPQTLGGDYLGAQIEGISKAVTTGDTGELYKGSAAAQKKAEEYYTKYGPIAFASSLFSEKIGIPLDKVSPLKISPALIPVEEGAKSIGIKLSVGYGKYSKPVISKIGKDIGIGSGKDLLKSETVARLSPNAILEGNTGRTVSAFELGTANDFTRELLTSEQGLKALVGASKILPTDVKFIKAQQRLAELAGLAQKKIKPSEYKQVEQLPRGIFEGLETVAEEETFIEKIIPKTRPVKGSQIFFTQLRQGLRPTGLLKSDTDIDYIGGLLGDRYATNRATEITRKTVESLNDVVSQQRAAVASGTKVFTGKIIEGVVFPPSKKSKLTKEQLQGGGEKLAEFLTSKDADKGTSSIVNDVSKIFNVKKSNKLVKVPTGYTGLFGPKYRKELTLGQQLLNQIASASRIQSKAIEEPFKGIGPIPFLKEGYTDLLRTQTGFRVGTDVYRLKDLVRQQPVALQIAEILESKGYKGKVEEVKNIFEDIKKAKPEIDFDAAYTSVEKIGESERIPSIISSIGSNVKGIKNIPGLIKIRTQFGKQKNETKKPSVQSSSKVDLRILDSIADIPASRTSIVSVSRDSPRPSSISSLGEIKISSGGSIGSKSRRGSSQPKVKKSPGSIASPTIKSPASIISQSKTSPGSPVRMGKIGKIPFSPFRSGKFTQPGSPSPRTIKIAIPFIFRFDQVKRLRLPSRAKRRFFIAGIPDPLRAGVFAPKGVRELRSSSPKIFRQIDINLAKARRNKKAFDPLNGFKIAKSGKYVYSSKNLLNSYTKIRI